MKNFLKKHSGFIIIFLTNLVILLLGINFQIKWLAYIGVTLTVLSNWICYLQGYADAINREGAIKVVHTIKDDTDKVVIKECTGKHDDLNNEAIYEYDKKWQDKFRHVINHNRTWKF